jgi:hypothetical protein
MKSMRKCDSLLKSVMVLRDQLEDKMRIIIRFLFIHLFLV